MLYYGDTFEVDGNTFKVTFPYDEFFRTPWEEDDGHGPVREAGRIGYHGRPHKAPGEMLLGDHWVYDFAEACKIARRDGWGTLPGDLVTRQDADGLWHASVATSWRYRGPELEATNVDVNAAIRAVYDAYRATFPSERAYAAAAAMADYDRLRRWCNDQWYYIGVVVTLCDDDGDPVDGYRASVWGIESDCHEYLEVTARELAQEILAEFAAINTVSEEA